MSTLGSSPNARHVAVFRPILRGKDIKRYGYEWADKYLIATFPSRHYDIELYPAVKQHLLSFGKKRLEQTGETHEVDGKKLKSRKKTNNKWFETQDSISYWEDFSKPKIIWKRVGSKLRFSFDKSGLLGLDSTCFAIGEHIAFLCCVLNSNFGQYLLKDSPKTGTGDLLVSVQAIEPIRVPYNESIEKKLIHLLNSQINNYSEVVNEEINRTVCSLYDLSREEISYIDEITKQFR